MKLALKSSRYDNILCILMVERTFSLVNVIEIIWNCFASKTA